MSEQKKTSGTEKEIPTDGIDIVPWTIASEDGTEVTYSTWDFAGQAVYYNTHQVSDIVLQNKSIIASEL